MRQRCQGVPACLLPLGWRQACPAAQRQQRKEARPHLSHAPWKRFMAITTRVTILNRLLSCASPPATCCCPAAACCPAGACTPATTGTASLVNLLMACGPRASRQHRAGRTSKVCGKMREDAAVDWGENGDVAVGGYGVCFTFVLCVNTPHNPPPPNNHTQQPHTSFNSRNSC
jgi:hypothetical protein